MLRKEVFWGEWNATDLKFIAETNTGSIMISALQLEVFYTNIHYWYYVQQLND